MPGLGYLKLGVSLLAVLGAALAGWTARDWKADADLLASERRAAAATERMAQRGDDSAWAYELFRADGVALETRTTNTIREVYKDAPPPSVDCALRPDAQRVLNTAIRATNSAIAGEPESPVPDTGGNTGERPGESGVGGGDHRKLPRLRWEAPDDGSRLADGH